MCRRNFIINIYQNAIIYSFSVSVPEFPPIRNYLNYFVA